MQTSTCDRCGLCCRYFIIPINPRDRSWSLPVNRDFLAARGIRIRKDLMIIPSRCEQLEPPAPGALATCRCYETRPTICKISSCKKGLLRYDQVQDPRGPAAADQVNHGP